MAVLRMLQPSGRRSCCTRRTTRVLQPPTQPQCVHGQGDMSCPDTSQSLAAACGGASGQVSADVTRVDHSDPSLYTNTWPSEYLIIFNQPSSLVPSLAGAPVMVTEIGR